MLTRRFKRIKNAQGEGEAIGSRQSAIGETDADAGEGTLNDVGATATATADCRLPIAPLVEPTVLDENERDPEDIEADEPSPIGDDDFPDVPDLVLVDGGQGQLAVAQEIVRELGVKDVALVGVAKGPDRDAGREHFHIPGRPKSLMLEPRDPVLYFVQRLRDEAHRFAIGTHRAKRAKAISANPLDEIDGIGPTRKRALLSHFGSAKAVSRAGVEDMKAVKGISEEMAQKIYDFFHDRDK